MNNIDMMISFFGWCAVLNIALLSFSTLLFLFLKEQISTIHSRLFGVTQARLRLLYIQFLGYYKLAIIMFNLIPYIALKLMT